MKPRKRHHRVKLFALALTCPVHAFAWTFAASPDVHTNDAVFRPTPTHTINADNRLLADVREGGAEFLLISGDFFSGAWLDDATARANYGTLPDGTFSLPHFIENCGKTNYGDVLTRFENPSSGLPIIGVIGDHELGDNRWSVGTEKAQAVPFFKQAFASAFTLHPDGTSRYPAFIGNIPQRPIGTPYENTSYAFIRNNVLFVVVDIFRFDGPNVRLDSYEGSVSSDIEGDHLAWFDAVLEAGRTLPEVQFIVVAAHDPAILPVNLIDTSSMTVKGAEKSAFWQTIRKHKVELYLPGEVHSFTSSVDETGPTVQLVSGYKGYSHSHLLFDVSDNRIDIRLREHADTTYTTYATTGTMTIAKTGGNTNIAASGGLAPIDRNGLIVGYNLDGTSYASKVPNAGQFTRYYYGIASNVAPAPGIIGNAGRFSGATNSNIVLPSTEATRLHFNPIIKDIPRTIACWVNTNSTVKGTAIALGGGWGTFALELNNGLPSVAANNSAVQAATSVPRINDGQWHHLAASFPGNGATIKDIALYVDGSAIAKSVTNPGATVDTWPWYGITVGANGARTNGFAGLLDDCGAWSSALSPGMIATLYQAGRDPGIKLDSATLDKVFAVFRGNKPAIVLDRTWYPTTSLPGTPGTITKYAAGDYTIVLTEDGAGVTTLADELPSAHTNLLTNPSFESNFTEWGGIGAGVITTNDPFEGTKAARFASSSGFRTYLYQDRRGLAEGTYTASLQYKRDDSFQYAHLGVKVIKPDGRLVERTQALGTRGAWAKASISVAVAAGDYIQLSVWMESENGSGALLLDDAKLYRE